MSGDDPWKRISASDKPVTKVTVNGVSFWTLLAIVFITLKLIGKITWSWFWVLTPIWGGLALAAVVVLGMIIVAVIMTMREERRAKRRSDHRGEKS